MNTSIDSVVRTATQTLVAVFFASLAFAQMPDVSQMSGVPLPTGDVPTGTVSVRVVRGDMSNNIANQPVELHGGGQTWQATTDESGRATFTGLAPGTSVHAMTKVDGQSIESREFTIPTSGGVRLILVAGATPGSTPQGPGAVDSPAMPPAAVPPANVPPGTVAFVGDSRFIVEIVDGAVELYALLDVRGGEGAENAKPLVFEPPEGAVNLTVLEGSSPQVKLDGRRVVVSGPFTARTVAQIAYQMPYGSGRVRFQQVLPAALQQTSLLVRKIGDVTFSSPQVSGQREMPIDGQNYYSASGPGLPAGGALDIELAGLPYHSRVPRYLALGLALLIALAGAWFAFRAGPAVVADDTDALERTRERLFAELVKLEEQHRAGRGDPARYAAKRADLTEKLEDIYSRLDGVSPLRGDRPAPGAPEGAAAEASLHAHRA